MFSIEIQKVPCEAWNPECDEQINNVLKNIYFTQYKLYSDIDIASENQLSTYDRMINQFTVKVGRYEQSLNFMHHNTISVKSNRFLSFEKPKVIDFFTFEKSNSFISQESFIISEKI